MKNEPSAICRRGRRSIIGQYIIVASLAFMVLKARFYITSSPMSCKCPRCATCHVSSSTNAITCAFSRGFAATHHLSYNTLTLPVIQHQQNTSVHWSSSQVMLHHLILRSVVRKLNPHAIIIRLSPSKAHFFKLSGGTYLEESVSRFLSQHGQSMITSAPFVP
jgi:hypothetical protein